MSGKYNAGDKRQKSLEKQRRQNRKDLLISKQAVEGFDWHNCEALHLFSKFFGREKVTTDDMRPIAQVCGHEYGILFPREAQRRKPNLLKWCNDHIDRLRELMNIIDVEYTVVE